MRRDFARFTDDTYRGVPGKDFDHRILHDPLPGNAKWHEYDRPMGFPPELSNPCVDLSGLLGTPAPPDATDDGPVDSPKPGECFYCKTKAVRMTGDGRPVCLFHKQFFFTRQLREDDLCG